MGEVGKVSLLGFVEVVIEYKVREISWNLFPLLS